MKAKEFISKLDDARIVAAIEAAEQRTSGEIRVFVSRRSTLGQKDIEARAAARFTKLGMTATAERNGVLIYFVPRERQFAIIGDSGIHAKCGKRFWEELAGDLRTRLARGEFTEGIVEAVTRTGEVLANYFPRKKDDCNELTNQVSQE